MSQFFNQASGTDVSSGRFSHAGRDQTLIHNIHSSGSIHFWSSGQPSHWEHPSDNPGDNKLCPDLCTSHQGSIPVTTDDCIFVTKRAMAIIIQIINILDNRDIFQALRLELESSAKILDLIKRAIKEYEDKPLGQSLANTITPEVERCCSALQVLLAKVKGILAASISPGIGFLRWALGMESNGDVNDLAMVTRRLTDSRNFLGRFLLALNSYDLPWINPLRLTEMSKSCKSRSVAWIDLGNERGAGPVPLQKFYTKLKQMLPLCGTLQLDTIQVLDHLGHRLVQVPTPFCSTWEVSMHLALFILVRLYFLKC